jgi:DeoR/GlpR family transcriptional regulator of sugar metabolism
MSEKVVLLADHSKINKRSFVNINSLDAVDIIIVDQKASKEYFSLEGLEKKKIIYSKTD